MAIAASRRMAPHTGDAPSLRADRRQDPARAHAADQPLLECRVAPDRARPRDLDALLRGANGRDRARPDRTPDGRPHERPQARGVRAATARRRGLRARVAEHARFPRRPGPDLGPPRRDPDRADSILRGSPARGVRPRVCRAIPSRAHERVRGSRVVPRALHRQVQRSRFLLGHVRSQRRALLGRRAPNPPAAPVIDREAYSHEVSEVGFWPGDSLYAAPAFFALHYPEPDGYARAAVHPAATRWWDPGHCLCCPTRPSAIAIRARRSSSSSRARTKRARTSPAGIAPSSNARWPVSGGEPVSEWSG